MPTGLYTFQLDSFDIQNTRAVWHDTDVASMGVKVDTLTIPNVTKALGDVDNGRHTVGLACDAFIKVDPAVQVALAFLIQNLGYSGSASAESDKALNWVSDKCKEIISNAFGYKVVWDNIDKIIQGINSILFADCDGPVAADSFTWTGQQLYDLTSGAGGGKLVTSKFYPGQDSAVGCGSNSEYIVNMSVQQRGVGDVYRIANRNSGKLLDLPGSSPEDGVIIQQYRDNGGGANQQWLLSPTGSGYFKIINRSSGKLLDVPGSVPTDGVEIQQYHDNGGGANQQWRVASVPADPGYVTIENRATGKVLDVPGSSLADGAPIQQYRNNGGTPNQEWLLSLADAHPYVTVAVSPGVVAYGASNGSSVTAAATAVPAGE